jgi:hypothetical protein
VTSVGPVIAELVGVLTELEIPFAVGGSFASGAWGQPRHTNDLDIAVRLEAADVKRLLASLGTDWIVSQEEILNSLTAPDEYRMFQLLHVPSLFKVDAFVPHRDGFAESTFRRATPVNLLGMELPCLTAEDIVIQKLRWFNLGNRISDKQWNDIVQVLELRQGLIDLDYLTRWASHFGLNELLQDALRQVRPKIDPFA